MQGIKLVIYSVTLAVLITAAAVTSFQSQAGNPYIIYRPAVLSRHKTISLTSRSQTVGTHKAITGTFAAKQESSLVYTLRRTNTSTVISSGAIPVDKAGSFSRHLPVMEPVQSGHKLQLTVYAQTPSGKVVDELSTIVLYE